MQQQGGNQSGGGGSPLDVITDPLQDLFGLGRGFNSHPVHFFLLYNYGISLSLCWEVV
jgi:hypothetical protein